MRNVRKYTVLMFFSLALIGLFVFNLGREFWPWGSRLEAALAKDNQTYALKGARLYAQNCMQCHGPRGEGVVGMPLNRPDLRGNPNDNKYADTYRLLTTTIAQGRPGTDVPLWVRTPDNRWASYTAMPAWGKDNGGPMDEHSVQALAYFIMLGDQKLDPQDEDSDTFWEIIDNKELAPAQPANQEAPLPDSKNLIPQDNERAKALLANQSTSMCLNCHAIGARGAKIGPDLTYVGEWGVDEAFLRRWITDPTKVPNEERMPVYWSQHRSVGPKPNFDPGQQVVSPVKTQMIPVKLTDEQRDLIIKYLLGLKR